MSRFVNSKVNLNIPKLNKLSKAAITALEETTEALHTEIEEDQVIPFRSGNLNDNTYPDYSDSNKGKIDLISPDVYARRLYFHPEYNFNRDEHKNAKGKWYDEYISGTKKNFCSKTFSEIYKKEAGL